MEKRLGEKDSKTSLYIIRFGVVKNGDYSLVFRHFNPKVGETLNDKVVIYKVRAR